jgi:Spx/MgsR family transcriptional regulator
MIEVYGIKSCGSVKKAVQFFQKHNLEYRLHDFKAQNVTCERVSLWLEKTDIKVLFNSKSTSYRTLQLKELNLDAITQKEWLCKENLLIKRPVVEFGEKLLVGFNEENYKGVFL